MDTTSTVDYSTSGTTSGAAVGIGLGLVVLYLAILALAIVSMWKIFAKAGKPGWAAIVPFYNFFVELEIVGRPAWWFVLLLIPFVNLVTLIIIANDLAKSFGKSTVFAIFGLILFPFIGFPMLAFGSAQYQGPSALGGATPPAAPPATPPVSPTPPAAPTPPATPPIA